MVMTPVMEALGIGADVAQYAAPVATAALGAGVSALAGGSPLTGALIGGGISGLANVAGQGGALGNAYGYLSNLLGGGTGAAGTAAVDPSMLSALGATGVDANGDLVGGAYDGMPASEAVSQLNQGAGGLSGMNAQQLTSATNAADSGASTGIGGGNPVSQSSGLLGGKGISGTAAALGALAALGSSLSKPQMGTWQTPQPSSNAANLGPVYNAQLYTNPTPTRQAVNPLAGQPTSAWYTYGQLPEQSFYQNNNLPLGYYGNPNPSPVQTPVGAARGGALAHLRRPANSNEFMTGGGSNHVKGPGTAVSDSIPARLSSGEYVLDSHDVTLMGGKGGNEAGARKLDKARKQLNRGNRRGALQTMLA